MTGKEEERDKRTRKGQERPRHSQRGPGGRRGRGEKTSDVEEGEDGAEGVPRIARAHAACPSTPASGPGARPCTCSSESSSSPALVLYHPSPSLAHSPGRRRLGDCHCSTQPWLRMRPSTPPRASRPSASSWLSQNTAYRRSWFRLKTNASIHSHCGHPRDAYDLA